MLGAGAAPGALQESPGRKDSFPLEEGRLPGRGVFEVGGDIPGVEVRGRKGLGVEREGGLGAPRSRACGGMCVGTVSWKGGQSEAQARVLECQAEEPDLGWGTRGALSGV